MPDAPVNTSSHPVPLSHRIGFAAVVLASLTCLGAAVVLAVVLLVDSTAAPHWSRPAAALAGLLGAGAALAGWRLLRRRPPIPEPQPARSDEADGFPDTEPLEHDAGASAQAAPLPPLWPQPGWQAAFEATMPDPDTPERDRMLAALAGAHNELDELASNALDLAALTANALRCADEVQAALVRARQRTGAAIGMGANAKAHQRLGQMALQQVMMHAWPPAPSGGMPVASAPAGDLAMGRLAQLAQSASASLTQGERDLLAQQEVLQALASSLVDLTNEVAKLRRMLSVQADCGRSAAEAAAAAQLDVERMRSALDA